MHVRLLKTFPWSKVKISCHLPKMEKKEIHHHSTRNSSDMRTSSFQMKRFVRILQGFPQHVFTCYFYLKTFIQSQSL